MVARRMRIGWSGSTLKTNLVSFWELGEASGTRADAH